MQHVLVGVVAAFVQPEQDGDRDVGGRPPGAAFLWPGEAIDVRLEDVQDSSRPASTDTGPLACSARSLAVISSASS
jgi:hypothetical protein